jgi:alanyl-tRNA synthetase
VEFVGYDNLETDTTVEEIWESPSGKKFLILQKTPFYAESGGQVGDTGKIAQEKLNLQVVDTQKENEIILHLIESNNSKLDKKIKGLEVSAQVDKARRKAIMKNHTATHLLHKALREHLGEHVHQAGSLVAPDRLRFDFSHFKELTDAELSKLEFEINQRIWENIEVLPLFDVPLKEALAMGAMALFGEKYGDKVRVIKIGEYSLELCGGTHTKTTGEIGIFRIVSETGVAAGVRRIESITGERAYKLMQEERDKLLKGANLLKTDPDKYLNRLENLLEEKRKIENRLKELEGGKASGLAEKLFKEAREIKGVKYIAENLGQIDSKEQLLNLADSFRKIPEFEKSYFLGTLVAQINSSFIILTFSSSIAVKDKNLKADQILKDLAALAGGSGGGKPTLATGGLKDSGKIEKVLENLPVILERHLRS